MPKASPRPVSTPPTDPPDPAAPPIGPLTARNDKATNALETLYDTLNEQLVAAEARLRALKPLRAATVAYGESRDEDGIRYWEELALIKIDDKWRLAHADCTNAYGNDSDYGPIFKPLTERTGEERLRAAKEVRRLYEVIVKQKEAMVAEVESAIKDLSTLCSEL